MLAVLSQEIYFVVKFLDAEGVLVDLGLFGLALSGKRTTISSVDLLLSVSRSYMIWIDPSSCL